MKNISLNESQRRKLLIMVNKELQKIDNSTKIPSEKLLITLYELKK